MPTSQPSNAPATPEPRDGTSAASVLSDDSLDRTPGGGSLGGAGALDGHTVPGGPSPNSPIDVRHPAPEEGGAKEGGVPEQAAAEARREAAATPAAEPHPSSQ